MWSNCSSFDGQPGCPDSIWQQRRDWSRRQRRGTGSGSSFGQMYLRSWLSSGCLAFCVSAIWISRAFNSMPFHQLMLLALNDSLNCNANIKFCNLWPSLEKAWNCQSFWNREPAPPQSRRRVPSCCREVGGGRDLWWEDWPPTGARCGSVGGGGWDGRTQPTPPRLRLKDSTNQTKVYLSGVRPDVMTWSACG